MNVIKLSVLVIVLVVAMIAYRVFNAEAPTAATTARQLGPASGATSTDLSSADTTLESIMPPVANNAGEEEQDCLTWDELNAHPLIRQLQSQADAAATNGAEIEKFRGIDGTSVRGYADQGDSAAMVVVGAMSVMRAFRMDASRAVDWLANGGELDGVVMQQQQMSSDASLALNDAAFWFYQAALHGKTFALRHYGQVRGQLFGGPVELGWIDQAEYDALGAQQQQDLWPVNMYGNAATQMTLVPDASDGQDSTQMSVETEITKQILSDITNEFDVAVVDAGLPPSTTSIPDIAEFARLESLACPSELSSR